VVRNGWDDRGSSRNDARRNWWDLLSRLGGGVSAEVPPGTEGLSKSIHVHKGRHEKGGAILAEGTKTYNPRLVLVGGGEPGHQAIGKSLVVSLGRLAKGSFTVIDLGKREVTARMLREPAKVA